MSIKDLWQNFVTRLRGGMDKASESATLDNAERTRQTEIIRARQYYSGKQFTQLTERQKEFLGFKDDGNFRVNYCKTVVNAVVERMILTGFDSDEPKQADGEKPLVSWADKVMAQNRFDALQLTVNRGMVRDSEYFVIVDLEPDTKQPRLIPHPRFTDSFLDDGTGFGCRAYYDDDDPTQPMKYASKRWTEEIEEDEKTRRIERMNLYYPDRVERFVRIYRLGVSTWEPYNENGEEIIPWKDSQERPLGIPVIHFKNPDLSSELKDAIPLQDGINKTTLDLLAAADTAGFPIRFTKGFYATTDGKSPASDGSNYLHITPGSFVGTTSKEADMKNMEGGDLSNLIQIRQELILDLARITDTPLSRFQATKQIAAEGTLKQQEEPLLAKIRSRQTTTGNSWEDAFYIARKLVNKFNNAGLDENITLSALWAPAETRDDKAFAELLKIKRELGVTQIQIWRELGYNEEQIQDMLDSDEQQMKTNLMQVGFGGNEQSA